MKNNTTTTKVIQLHAQEGNRVDDMLLEMENKANALRNEKSLRELKKEQKATARSRFMDDTIEFLNSVVEDPNGMLMKIKPISNVMHYFFYLEDEEDDEAVVYEDVIATPVMPATSVTRTKEGNVVHVNFNK